MEKIKVRRDVTERNVLTGSSFVQPTQNRNTAGADKRFVEAVG